MIFSVKTERFFTKKCIYDMTYCEDVIPEIDKNGQWTYWFDSRTFHFWILTDGVNTYKPQLVLKSA